MYKHAKLQVEMIRGLGIQLLGLSIMLYTIVHWNLGLFIIGLIFGSVGSAYGFAMIRVADWEKNTQ